MKRTILTTICVMLLISLKAQIPHGISHQAVIRNAANELVTNLPVGIRVSILQGAPDGTEIFSETHTPQSNANGLITFVIGQGASQSSDFSAIDWAEGIYFVKTEADPTGGTNYTIDGVSRLWSVPYALSANASFSLGDSLVLKDDQGMTRFVLNPNDGMLKMMHNDTLWYSIEVGSPHLITYLNDDMSLIEQTGNVQKTFLFSERDKSIKFIRKETSVKHDGPDKSTTTTKWNDLSTGTVINEESETIQNLRDEAGNLLSQEITEIKIENNPDGSENNKTIVITNRKEDSRTEKQYKNGQLEYVTKEERNYLGQNVITEEHYENGELKKKEVKTHTSGMIISRTLYEESLKQSETTNSTVVVPDMGFRSQTVTEETFQGEDETLIKKETITKSSKHSPEEKYEQQVTTNQFYKDGVISREVIESLVDQWNETVKIQERIAKMFDQGGNQVSEIKIKNTSDADYDQQSGSMSRSNTTEMFANGVKVADQNRNMNHYPDPSNYTEDSESSAMYLPSGSVISKIQLEKATWPGGTQEKTTRTYVDNIGITTQFVEQLQNGLPQNSYMTKDGIYRINTMHTHNDNEIKFVTSYKNASNTTTAKLTEEFKKNDAQHKRTVEKPGEGSTTFYQANNEIKLQANQVISDGDHFVTGMLNVTGTKLFRIDHPADTSKYLQHAAIESNEVLNQYSGNVITDAGGLATVTLPDYFHLVNIDFRYQLTVMGASFAHAIIFSEIDANNQFVIKTDEPNTKVSWQVTAKRNDQYLINNPFSDVVDK